MEFHQILTPKRPRSCAGDNVSTFPLQSFALVETVHAPPPSELQTLPEQVPVSYGSSSSFQAYDNTRLAPLPSAKRRRLDGYVPMSQENASFCHDGFEEEAVKSDPFGQQFDGQPPLLACWSEEAAEPSMPPGLPLGLAKQMTNLSLLLCPCSGFGWGQADGYCPLPEASPTGFDQDQPYTAEKLPSMHMPTQPRSDGLPFLETEEYCSVQCPQGTHTLPSLLNYTQQEHVQLVSPSGSAKDVFFPSNHAALAHYSNDYVAQGLQRADHVAFHSAYLENDDGAHMDQVSDFADTLGANSVPLPSMTACAQVAQFSMLAGGEGADGTRLGSWSEGSVQHQQPSNFDILLPDQRGGKRGPFKDPKLREQTAQTRRTGSCIRCRMQRIRCESDPGDPGGVCLTCTNVANTKAGRFPCLRYKITDIKLYKPGQVPGYEWTRRWTNNITDPIQTWASPQIKVIRVSAGYSKRFIELQVREFKPQDGDKLFRTWDDKGTRKCVEIPPYAVIDLEATKSKYSTHIQEIMTDTIQHVLAAPDGLLQKTYVQALRLMYDPATPVDSAKLLRSCLTLWISIRLSTTSGFLVGEETLGMPRNILDESSPDAGKIPMPPVLGAQLDLVLIHHIQTKLRREMLELLQKMVLKNKQMTWFVTYLVTFILLHNTALITAHDAGYARKHGMKRRFAREDKVREYHLGANILLAHFHYCNKGVYPFSGGCKDKDLRTLADLKESEIQFVHATRNHVKRHRREWEQVREKGVFEDDYFFVSQLFDERWKPQPTM